ncbi:MAG: hypothetical protein IT200_12565 [Thermoleophilia bacterium]|nr:hypothetical protein [Thermoleophilia bacterium]
MSPPRHPDSPSPDDLVASARDLVERDPLAAIHRAAHAMSFSGSARTMEWATAVTVRGLHYTGRTHEALRTALPLPRRFRTLGEPAGTAYVLTDLSALLMVTGNLHAAAAAIAEGLAAAQRGRDRACQAHLLQNRAIVSIIARDLVRAEPEARAGLEVTGELGAHEETSHFQLAEIRMLKLSQEPWRAGRTRLVEEALHHGALGVERAGPGRLMVEALRWETEALAWAGDHEAALQRGLQASHLADPDDGEAVATGRISRALGYAAAGMRGEALGTIREATARASREGWASIDARRVEGDLLTGALGSR